MTGSLGRDGSAAVEAGVGVGQGGHSARCRRVVVGPPELAFSLWADGALLAEWMAYRESGPADGARLVAVDQVVVGAEPGDRFGLDMITRSPDGSLRTWSHGGEVLDVEPPSRLAVTWISEGTEHRRTDLVLRFRAAPAGGTEILLDHTGFASREMADRHAEGWDILMELFSEAMMSALGAGVKIAAAELKRRLAVRPEASEDDDGRSEPRGDDAESG